MKIRWQPFKPREEEIPDNAWLFRTAYMNQVRANGTIKPGAFVPKKNDRGRLSADWEKYSTPQQTRQRPAQHGGDPERFGVVALKVGIIRTVPNQRVKHTPSRQNKAHSTIFGYFGEEDDDEARRILARDARVVIDQNGQLLPPFASLSPTG